MVCAGVIHSPSFVGLGKTDSHVPGMGVVIEGHILGGKDTGLFKNPHTEFGLEFSRSTFQTRDFVLHCSLSLRIEVSLKNSVEVEGKFFSGVIEGIIGVIGKNRGNRSKTGVYVRF